MEQKEGKMPFHSRFGARLLQVLLIILCMVLVKRCVDIYHDNKITDQQIKMEYFGKGFASDMKNSKGLSEDPEPQFKNYALKIPTGTATAKGGTRQRKKRRQISIKFNQF